MKLPSALLQSIALGITLTVVASSCHRDEIKDGTAKTEKEKKREQKEEAENCPACGMG